jgi:hypothetical protein
LRLDPRALPVRYHATDARADGATRTVELYSDRVLVERTVRGIPMRLKVPLSSFLGVSVRKLAAAEGSAAIAVTLEHRDPGLSIPLLRTADEENIVADWRRWADALARPLLVAGPDGALYAISDSIGALMVAAATARRRRRTPLKRRGPRFAARRATARASETVVHRGEREIITPE